MKYPILYDKNTTDFFNLGLGPLTNAIEAKVIEERNGAFYFEGTFVNDKKFNIIEDNIIVADASYRLKNQRFIIKKITKSDDGTIKVHADHISNKTEDFTLVPKVYIKDCDADQALKIWKSSIIDKNNFIVDSDIQTVNSTSWDIADVENSRQALGGVRGSLLDTYGGEYLFDNEHISLLRKRGKTANTILAYGKNITDIEQEINIKTTYNSVYPFAKYETGEEGNKKEHIVTVDGYFVDSKYVVNYPTRKAKVVDFSGEFKEDEVPTKAKLKSLGEKYVKNNNIGVPNVSLKLSFLDLAKSINYKDSSVTEEIELCDDVFVYYSDLNIETTAKVNRVEWDVLMDRFDNIEVGDKKSSLSSTISQTVKDVNEIGKGLQDLTEGMNTAVANANGKNTNFYGLFGEDGLGEPKANAIGDLWFKPYGKETQLYKWNGTEWEFILSTEPNDNIINQIEKLEKESDELDKKAEEALKQAEDNHNKALELAEEITKNQEKIDINYQELLDSKQNFQNSINDVLNDVSKIKNDGKNLSNNVSKLEQSYIKFDTDIKQNKKDLNKAQNDAIQALSDSAKALAEAEELLKKSNEQKLLINDTQADISDLQNEAESVNNKVNNLSDLVTKQGLDIKSTQDSLNIQVGKIDKQSAELASLKINSDKISSSITSLKQEFDNSRSGYVNLAWNLSSYSLYNTDPIYDASRNSFKTVLKSPNHESGETYLSIGLKNTRLETGKEYVISGNLLINEEIISNEYFVGEVNTYLAKNKQKFNIDEKGRFTLFIDNNILNLQWLFHCKMNSGLISNNDVIELVNLVVIEGNRPVLYFPPEELKHNNGTNLVLESDKKFKTSNYFINTYKLTEDLKPGEQYTLTIKGTIGREYNAFGCFIDAERLYVGKTVYDNYLDIHTFTFVCPEFNEDVKLKNVIDIFNYPSVRNEATIEWIKLERGIYPTDWSPTPSEMAKQSTVEQLSTDLTQTNESIKLKADKIVVDNLNKTVEKQNSELTVINDGIKLKADKSDLDSTNKILTKQQSELSVMSDSIKAQSSKTDENSKQIADLKLSSGEISSTVSKIEKKVDNAVIYSRNYLKNSNTSYELSKINDGKTYSKKIDGIYKLEDLIGKTVTVSLDIEVENFKLNPDRSNNRAGFEMMLQNTTGQFVYIGAWKYFSEEGESFKGRVSQNVYIDKTFDKFFNANLHSLIDADVIKLGNPKISLFNDSLSDISYSIAPEDLAKQDDLIETNTLINQTNESIKLKADKTEVNTISQKVDKQSSEIKIANDSIGLKADKSTVDTLTKKVNTNTSKIDVLNDNISLKVDKTEVDNLKNTVDKQGTQLNLNSDEIKAQAIKVNETTSQIATIKLESDRLSSVITKTQSDLNSLKVGTRNIIIKGNVPFSYKSETPNNEIVKTGAYRTYVDVGDFKEYTLAFKAKGKGIFRPAVIGTYLFGDFTLTNEYQVFTSTIKTWAVVSKTLHFFGTNLTELDLEWIMLVEGNKIGDFEVAPEEKANTDDVLELSSRVSQTESDITAQVSKVDKNTKEIANLVLESGRLSSTISKVENNVNTSTTGTRNLAWNLSTYSDYGSVVKYDGKNNSFSTTIKKPSSGNFLVFALRIANAQVEAGSKFVFSGYLKINDKPVKENPFSSRVNTYLSDTYQSFKIDNKGYFNFKYENPIGAANISWIIHAHLRDDMGIQAGDVISITDAVITEGNQIVTYFPPDENRSIGGRNLVLDSNQKVNTNGYLIKRYNLSEDWVPGQQYTLSIKGNLANKQCAFGLWIDTEWTFAGQTKYEEKLDIYSFTFMCPEFNKTPPKKNIVSIYKLPSGNKEEAVIDTIKIEKGPYVTGWTPAPEDFASEKVVSEISTTLEQTNKDILLQASKVTELTTDVSSLKVETGKISSSVTSLSGKVDVQTSKLEQTSNLLNAQITNINQNTKEISNIKIENGKISSEVSSMNDDITLLSSKIDQTDKSLTAQVAKIDKNTIDISSLKLESGKLSSTIASTKNDIDSLINDSFNYLQNSGIKIRKFYLSNSENYSVSIPGIYNKSELSNQEVIVSVDINVKNASLRVGKSNRVGFEMVLENNNNKGKNDVIYVEVWKNLSAGESFQGRITNKVKIPSGYVNFISAGIHSQINANEIEIKNPKVALNTGGMNDKIYSPSPMDNAKQTDFSELIQTVDSISTKVETKANQSSVTQLSTQLTSVVKDNEDNKSSIVQMKSQISTLITDNNNNKSSITQLSNQISLKVSSNELVSKINMSPESIRIQSKFIHLNGNSLIDNATIKSAMIDTISANKITTGILNAGNVFVINLNAGNISTGTLSADRIAGRSITADKLSANAIQVGFNNMGNTLQIFPSSLNFYEGSRLSGKITENGMQFWYGNRYIGSMGDRGKAGDENIRGISNQLNYEGDYIAWSYKRSSSESNYTTMMTLDPRGKFTGMSGIVMGQTIFVSQIASNDSNTRGINVTTTRFNNNYYAKLSYPSGNGSGILFGASSLYFLHGGFVYSFNNLAKFANLGSMSLYIPTSLNGISSGSYVKIDL